MMKLDRFDEDAWSDYGAGAGLRSPGSRPPIRIGAAASPFVCEAVPSGEPRLVAAGEEIPVLWGALTRLLLDAGLSLRPGQRLMLPREAAVRMIEEALSHVGGEWRRLERDVRSMRTLMERDGEGSFDPMIGAMAAIQAATNRIRAREKVLRRALALGGRRERSAA